MGSESCFAGDAVPEAVVDVGEGEGYRLAGSSWEVLCAIVGEFGREGVRERGESGEEGTEPEEEREESGLEDVVSAMLRVARARDTVAPGEYRYAT